MDKIAKRIMKPVLIERRTNAPFKGASSSHRLCRWSFDWAKYRKAKGAVKPHLNLDGDKRIPFDAYMTNGKAHEVKAMKNLTGETGVIYALDRGYVNYKSLYSIELQGSFFVTRMKSNGAFKRAHNKAHDQGGPVLSDVLIELTGAATKKAYPKPLRKIKYKDPETKKAYGFLTNDMEREAKEIAVYTRSVGKQNYFSSG